MKIIETTIYKCEFCNKLYQIKKYCQEHELICTKNPDNFRACHSCNNLTKKQCEVEKFNYIDGYYKEFNSLLYCKKLEVFIHTPKTEKRKKPFNTSPVKNIPMPTICKKIDMPDYFKEYTSNIDKVNIERHKNLN